MAAAAPLFLALLAAGGFVGADAAGGAAICPSVSPKEAILGPNLEVCAAPGLSYAGGRGGVVEGDEATLLRAVNFVQKNAGEYIVVLFYASWCPFSKVCKPNFQKMATFYPSVRHFAFEESAIRPSILSRYGVHGFPTLFILNSTMRVRYHGPRDVESLAGFYREITGVNASMELMAPNKVESADFSETMKSTEPESCPFWWARSPEKLLEQDTYLALAFAFVALRILYFIVPMVKSFVVRTWRRHLRFASLMQFLEYFRAYITRSQQGASRLNSFKRTNLHDGAMNATAWASKSFASVSIGEPSSRLTSSSSERR